MFCKIYFIRGLALLLNIIAVVTLSSSVIVAGTNVRQSIKSPKQIVKTSIPEDKSKTNIICKARNQINQMYWRIKARTMRNDSALLKEHKWIKQPEYIDSIEKVIGEAIADRITNEREFNGKSADDVITFDEQTKPETYDQPEWNAVVLWNFIHQAYCYCIKEGADSINFKNQIQSIMTNLEGKIFEKYSTYFKEKKLEVKLNELESKITAAISILKQYVAALEDMPSVLCRMFYFASLYDESLKPSISRESRDKMTPETCMCPDFTIDKNDSKRVFLKAEINMGSKGEKSIKIPIKLDLPDDAKNSKLNLAIDMETLYQILNLYQLSDQQKTSIYGQIFDLFVGLY